MAQVQLGVRGVVLGGVVLPGKEVAGERGGGSFGCLINGGLCFFWPGEGKGKGLRARYVTYVI